MDEAMKAGDEKGLPPIWPPHDRGQWVGNSAPCLGTRHYDGNWVMRAATAKAGIYAERCRRGPCIPWGRVDVKRKDS